MPLLKKQIYTLLSSLLALSISYHATASISFQNENDTSQTGVPDSLKVEIAEDDPVLIQMDELWTVANQEWLNFSDDSVCLNKYEFEFGIIPDYPDSIIAERLAKLNRETPLELDFNPYVRAFINLYTNKRRDVTARVLGLSAYYYPIFEEKLDQFDIPLELKHLAVVESALNNSAKSRVGATGLWQFMYATGKIYDLDVTSFVDDRKDPYKSTIAACRYMRFLYDMYGDWNLVLAAYNSGPGNVNKAIRRSGGKRDYWSIRPYLPRETRGYVPAFIAVNYVMNYYAEHNLYPSTPSFLYGEVDTLQVCRQTRFDQISYFTGLSLEELELLNPVFKRNIIPEDGECHTLYLPKAATGMFLANEDEIYEFHPDQPQAVDGYILEETEEIYTVRSGDVLGLIAQRHGVSLTELRETNHIRGNNIYPGQKLTIRKTVKKKVETDTESQKETQASVEEKNDSGTVSDDKSKLDRVEYHIVQKGDTLWDIAKKYPGISANDIKNANSGINSSHLKPGQKIKIPPQS